MLPYFGRCKINFATGSKQKQLRMPGKLKGSHLHASG